MTRLIDKVKKLEDKAKKSFELRNQYRSDARNFMRDRKLAKYLEEVERNMTWDELLKRTLNKKYVNSIEEAYEEIIKSALKGREPVDELFKL